MECLIENLADIVDKVQIDEDCVFDPDEVYDTLRFTLRKCELNGKGEDYVPILFENELHDLIMRERINLKGRMNHVRNLYAQPVPEPVSQCS